ncbi:MAG: type IV pilus secretin PilQ [Methylococcaceae bacterium]
MKTQQSSIVLNQVGYFLGFFPLLFLLLCQSTRVNAGDLAITAIDFASLSGDKLQIQLDMNGAAVQPKVFKTDNPARIALDFVGVTNALAKKMIPVNQGAVSTIYIAEAADRIRVVINLLEATPFETKVAGNKVLLTLNRTKTMISTNLKPVAAKPKMPLAKKNVNSVVATLIPEQVISGFDFKRGDKGEGRILIYLANPDTVVNSKQEGGKVVINLLNTRLPENLAKRLDVSEFATPIKFIDTVALKQETTVTVTTQNELYDYSLFQSEGLLTIEFRPLSIEEKDALDRVREKYKGDRLSLNFQEIDIRSVIAILAEFTGQNVVAGDDVNGTITLKLDDVPWDEALDFIMMTKGLEKFESGTVTLIAPVGKIKEYKEKQQETATVIEQLDPLVTEYIKINYAKAENFRNLLNGLDTGEMGTCGTKGVSGSGTQAGVQSGAPYGIQPVTQPGTQTGTQGKTQGAQNEKFKILSSRGSAVVDARTNTLIVRETTIRLEEAKKLIRKLDVPVRQVMIESRIVIASNRFAKTLGVRFGVAGTGIHVGGLTNGQGLPVGSVNTLGGTSGSINGTAIVNDALVNLPASNPYGALGMTLARGADYVLNLELQALQDQSNGEIVSNPRVMTTDRCTAKILQGSQIPYFSGGTTGVAANTQFVNALLELDVLPQITPSGSISMNLNITKDEPGPSNSISGGPPPITKRQVETTVQVMDGETVVLGGVFDGNLQNTTNAVPFLADLPGIGFLFKRTDELNEKKELLIFITPKIVNANTASN